MNSNPPAKQLKELPQSPKKGKIYEMYGKQYSINTMKINLDGIIEEYKKLTKKHVSPREVPQPVWIEWLKNFGFPEHYQTDFALAERKTIFDKQ